MVNTQGASNYKDFGLTKEFISKTSQFVIPACRESFFTIPDKSEGLRTSRNDRTETVTWHYLWSYLISIIRENIHGR